MFVTIANTPRDYAWGAPGAISRLLGLPERDAAEAELWMGTHAGSPSRIVGTGAELASVSGHLPFLMKVLAANEPLSLQAHPTPEQARAGFDAEEAAGIAVDAPNRNYRDPFHKPELIYALEDGFRALCGFRPVEETLAELDRLIALDGAIAPLRDRLRGDADLRPVFGWLIEREAGADAVIAAVSAVAQEAGLRTAAELATRYPGGPEIAISLLLNDVVLRRGEVLSLPAGNIHAYLSGIGIEVMASSDNVLRGGMTPKHIDVPELLSVLDFTAGPPPYLEPERPADGVEVFRPNVPDFLLTVVHRAAAVRPLGKAIALCVDGTFQLASGPDHAELRRGDAIYLDSDQALDVTGSGLLFVASRGVVSLGGPRPPR